MNQLYYDSNNHLYIDVPINIYLPSKNSIINDEYQPGFDLKYEIAYNNYDKVESKDEKTPDFNESERIITKSSVSNPRPDQRKINLVSFSTIALFFYQVSDRLRDIFKRCQSETIEMRPIIEEVFSRVIPHFYNYYKKYKIVSVGSFSNFFTSPYNDRIMKELKIMSNNNLFKIIHSLNLKKGTTFMTKIFPKSVNTEEKIFREFQILNSLKHPSIVSLNGFAPDQNTLFLESASKGPLTNNKTIPLESFYQILKYLSSALCYIHNHGIILRSLSPNNIYIRQDLSPVIIDFQYSSEPLSTNAYLTDKYAIIDCMPPEFINGEAYSYSADVFSFGLVVAFFFLSDTKLEEQRAFAHDDTEYDLENIPVNVQKLIKMCLSFDPAQRPSFNYLFRYISEHLVNKNNDKNAQLEQYHERRDKNYIELLDNFCCLKDPDSLNIKGMELIYSGRIGEARSLFVEGSSFHHPACCNNLGMMSYLGLGKPQNINESIKWFQKASEYGDDYGNINLGIVYENYKYFNIEPKNANAVSMYKRSKLAKAKYLIGLKDHEYAKTLDFTSDSDICNLIGKLVEDGEIESPKHKAKYYYKVSAFQRNPSGLYNYSRVLKKKHPEKSEYYMKLAQIFGELKPIRTSLDILHEIWEPFQVLHTKAMNLVAEIEYGDEKAKTEFWEFFKIGYGVFNQKINKDFEFPQSDLNKVGDIDQNNSIFEQEKMNCINKYEGLTREMIDEYSLYLSEDEVIKLIHELYQEPKVSKIPIKPYDDHIKLINNENIAMKVMMKEFPSFVKDFYKSLLEPNQWNVEGAIQSAVGLIYGFERNHELVDPLIRLAYEYQHLNYFFVKNVYLRSKRNEEKTREYLDTFPIPKKDAEKSYEESEEESKEIIGEEIKKGIIIVTNPDNLREAEKVEKKNIICVDKNVRSITLTKPTHKKKRTIYIDLHGLTQEKAKEFVNDTINKYINSDVHIINFITGRGKHSQGGIPVLRPLVLYICHTMNISAKIKPDNEGIVQLVL